MFCFSFSPPHPFFFFLSPTVLYQLPHPIPFPLSSSLLIVRVLLGAYQAHRTMFPSNRAFILSLPWQLPISPKESLGAVFPWRWHGDIAKPLWTACRDSGPFSFPPHSLLFPLSSSLPILLLLLWQRPHFPGASNSLMLSACLCVFVFVSSHAHSCTTDGKFSCVFVNLCAYLLVWMFCVMTSGDQGGENRHLIKLWVHRLSMCGFCFALCAYIKSNWVYILIRG